MGLTATGAGLGAVAAGAGAGLGAGAGTLLRSFINSSARAKKSSAEIFPASTSARMERWALYSLFSMPALLWSRRQAFRRSTQNSTSWRESARYSTPPLAPGTLM